MADNLPLSGVRLVADNSRGFIQDMARGRGALDAFESSAEKAASGGMETLGLKTIALGTAIGNVLAQAVTKGFGALYQFGQQAVQNAAGLQTLVIGLESLIAKEYKMSGAVDNMTEALDRAKPAAQLLLKEIEKISLISPFEYQDVVQVFRLNVAFGIAVGTSLELTRAILDLTAAGGHGAGMMNRIAYNFAQMSRVGKITSRDMRDLSMAGVDLAEVLRTTLGKSIDEVNAALERGDMTFEDVSQAFVRYADENFGGAAQRMSRTFQGVFSSFKDLIFFSSKAVASGALQEVTNLLGDILDGAMALVRSGALERVGTALEVIAGGGTDVIRSLFGIKGAMEEVTPATEGMALVMEKRAIDAQNAFRQKMEDTIAKAFGWGANIVTSLAEGMIAGVAAVLSAIAAIGSVLANWLSPGSPPKVAPSIDKWGMDAMTEFLKGFSQADFSALNAMQRPLQSALSTLVASGAITAQESAATMGSISSGLIAAMSSGEGFSSVLKDISAIGPVGPEIAQLVKDQYELALATEAVIEAEKKLKDAREDQFESSKKVSELTKEYNDLLRSGADQATLDAKLAEINAEEELGEAAKERAEAAGEELETAAEGIDDLQERVALQQALVDQLLEMARLQAQTTAPLGGGAAALSGFDGGIDLSDILADVPDADEIMEAFKERLVKIWDDMIADITTKFEESGITDLWDDLSLQWGEIWENLKLKWAEIWPIIQGIFQTAWIVIQAIWNQAVAIIGPQITELMGKFEGMGITWETVKTIVIGAIYGVVAILLFFVSVAIAVVSGIIDAWTYMVVISQFIWDGLKNIFEGLLTFVMGVVVAIVEAFRGNWDLVKQATITAFMGIWQFLTGILAVIIGAFVFSFAAIIGFVSGFVTAIIDFFKGLYDDLVGHSIIPDMLSDIIDAFVQFFKDALEDIGTWVTDALALFDPVAWLDAGKAILKGLLDGMVKFWDETLWPWIEEHFGWILDMLNEIFDFGSPSRVMEQRGEWIMSGLAKGLEKSVDDPARVMQDAVDSMMAPAPVLGGGNTYVTQSMELNETLPVNNMMDAEQVRLIIRDEVSRAFRR